MHYCHKNLTPIHAAFWQHFLKGSFWIFIFQATAIAGQLVGVRLLTNVISPTVFGKLYLWLGVVAFFSTCMVNPILQGMLRYYPEYKLVGKETLIRNVVWRLIQKVFLIAYLLFFITVLFLQYYGLIEFPLILVLSTLLTCEVVRLYGLAFLNANQQHFAYGAWQAMEACLRPFLGWVLAIWIAPEVIVIMMGFLVATIVNLLIMWKKFYGLNTHSEYSVTARETEQRIWRYVRPLWPLSLIGWITSMADRYVISGMLSIAAAGKYVAIASLASRPMLILGNGLETVVRPIYFDALTKGKEKTAMAYVYFWGGVVILFAWPAVFLANYLHAWIAQIFLGAEYRDVSSLWPILMAGYAVLILSYVPTRVCYAYEATGRVLLIEACGAIAFLGGIFLGTKYAEVAGAALAVFLAAACQFVVSLLLAKRWFLPVNIALSNFRQRET